MSDKDYNSPMYYAQQFRDFILGDKNKTIFRNHGWAFPNAEHHDNLVIFKINNVSHYLTFEEKKGRPYVVLEMRILDKEGRLRQKNIRQKLDIKKGKQGGISGNYMPLLFKNFVMKNYRQFVKEDKRI